MKRILFIIVMITTLMSCNAQKNYIDMVAINGEEFMMGTNKYQSVKPHKVSLDNYFFARNLVTVNEWKEFCEDSEYDYNWNDYYDFINKWREEHYFLDPLNDSDFSSDWPMLFINWNEAILYCNWLSRKHGFQESYKIDLEQFDYNYLTANRFDVVVETSANGYRLPTEAEWEYVAQKGFLNPEIEIEYFNYSGLLIESSLLNPNNLGIIGMDANARIWCWDYFDFEYYLYSDYQSPLGPDVANEDKRQYYPGEFEQYGENVQYIRTVRGGSIYNNRESHSFIYTRGRSIDFRRLDIGIRLVRNKS